MRTQLCFLLFLLYWWLSPWHLVGTPGMSSLLDLFISNGFFLFLYWKQYFTNRRIVLPDITFVLCNLFLTLGNVAVGVAKLQSGTWVCRYCNCQQDTTRSSNFPTLRQLRWLFAYKFFFAHVLHVVFLIVRFCTFFLHYHSPRWINNASKI